MVLASQSCCRFQKVLSLILLTGFMGLFCAKLDAQQSVKLVFEKQETAKSDAAQESKATDDKKVDAETKALHDKLSKYLTGTKWTGQFTMDGKGEPRTEHYEILTAEKNEVGDFWNLVARIKYGDHDQTFPLPPIEIKFAGKTPVITVDKVRFPGFGTFDARVLIRSGKYSGTWAHSGGAGGHMFGTIEKMDAKEAEAKMEKMKEEKEKKGEKEETKEALFELPAGTKGIKNKVKIVQNPKTGSFTLIGDKEDIALVQGIVEKLGPPATAAKNIANGGAKPVLEKAAGDQSNK